MTFFSRDLQEMVFDGLEKLSANTNVTQLSPGSKARFLLDTVYEEQHEQFRIFDTNLAQAFIKYADDKFLDYFGDMLNVLRLQPSHAEDTGQNMSFYVATGTFGDINGNASFDIPAGATISTVQSSLAVVTPGIDTQPVVRYQTTETVTCEPGDSIVFVPIRATVEGKFSTVARNVLNSHNFTGYLTSSTNALKCTNLHAVQNGVDRETTASYRFRLLNAFAAKDFATRSAIRLAALSVPGVVDIEDVPVEQGPGSFSLYVKGLTPTTGPRLINEVSSAISTVVGAGERVFVLAPNPVGLEFVVKVHWSPRATQEQIAEGYREIRTAVEEYFSTLEIGQELVFSDLISLIISVSPLVIGIGGIKPNEFDEIYMHRADPAVESSTIRSLVFGTQYVPLYNEILILETSGRFRGIQFR